MNFIKTDILLNNFKTIKKYFMRTCETEEFLIIPTCCKYFGKDPKYTL